MDLQYKHQLIPLIEELIQKRPKDIIKFIHQYAAEKMKNKNENNQDNQNSGIFLNRKHVTPRKGISAESYGQYNQKIQAKKPQNCNLIELKLVQCAEQKKFLKKILSRIFLFEILHQAQLDQIISSIYIRKVKSGQVILQEGKTNYTMYIIKQGFFIQSKIKGIVDDVVKMHTKGDCFGQLSIMYSTISSYSITSDTFGQLFCLDRQNFSLLINEIQSAKKQKYDKILKKICFLTGVSSDQKCALADIIKEEYFNYGEYIFKCNEKIKIFYIVLDGKVEQVQKDKQGVQKVIKIYQPQEYFAQVCLFGPCLCKTSMRSLTSCVVLSIDGDSLRRIVGTLEEILQRNIQSYKKIASSTKLLGQSNHLISNKSLKSTSQIRKKKKNSIILEQ